MTKARVHKSVGQEKSPGVWESVRINIHIPKWTPVLGVGVSVDSWYFREWLQRSKPLALKSSLYHWKAIEAKMSKMGSHDPFGHVQHKLWPNERSGVKLAIWLTTTESQESTQFHCVQVACDMPLERSRRALQLQFIPHPNRRFAQEVMNLQSCESPNFSNFGTLTWESRDKNHSDATPARRCRVYYMGEGHGFPWVRAMVSLVSPRLLVGRPNTKGVPTCASQLACWFGASLCEWVKLLVTLPSPIP